MSYELYNKLKRFGRVRLNVLLAKLSNFKIGGPADIVIQVTATEKLVALLNYLSGEGVEFFILGGGSNVLLPDEGFQGVVVKVESRKSKVEGRRIEVEAGMDLGQLVQLSVENNLAGLEWAAGIPGTVGGAIRGNAGAHYAFTGGEIKDSLQTVEVWRDGEVVQLVPDDCRFGYRDSIFKHHPDVILSACFNLQSGDDQESLLMTQKIIAERKGKQSSLPFAGSFFKNRGSKSDWKF